MITLLIAHRILDKFQAFRLIDTTNYLDMSGQFSVSLTSPQQAGNFPSTVKVQENVSNWSWTWLPVGWLRWTATNRPVSSSWCLSVVQKSPVRKVVYSVDLVDSVERLYSCPVHRANIIDYQCWWRQWMSALIAISAKRKWLKFVV